MLKHLGNFPNRERIRREERQDRRDSMITSYSMRFEDKIIDMKLNNPKGPQTEEGYPACTVCLKAFHPEDPILLLDDYTLLHAACATETDRTTVSADPDKCVPAGAYTAKDILFADDLLD